MLTGIARPQNAALTQPSDPLYGASAFRPGTPQADLPIRISQAAHLRPFPCLPAGPSVPRGLLIGPAFPPAGVVALLLFDIASHSGDGARVDGEDRVPSLPAEATVRQPPMVDRMGGGPLELAYQPGDGERRRKIDQHMDMIAHAIDRQGCDPEFSALIGQIFVHQTLDAGQDERLSLVGGPHQMEIRARENEVHDPSLGRSPPQLTPATLSRHRIMAFLSPLGAPRGACWRGRLVAAFA